PATMRPAVPGTAGLSAGSNVPSPLPGKNEADWPVIEINRSCRPSRLKSAASTRNASAMPVSSFVGGANESTSGCFVAQTLFVHTPRAQSESAAQPLPRGHFAHVGPPQSTSVSMPSLRPFAQGDAAHLPLVQVALAQSAPATQLRPSGQPGQLPPQSRSDSVPFLTPSVHDG